MGTRGHLGGLAEATLQALLVLDAAGKDIVFVETVGTGQSEVEVIGIADTVLLVLMPGSGDSIQALKAGIMEIPDVIAVNKKDHPAAKTMLNEVRSILTLDKERAWKPPIVLTEAVTDEGVADLWAKVEGHRAFLDDEGLLAERRRKNLAREVFAVASARAKTHLERAVEHDPELRRLLDEVQQRELDPLTAVREIMERFSSLATETAPTLADVEAARTRIAGKGVRTTPLYSTETFGRMIGRPVHLKAETLQRTGSFKIRGATNKLETLTDEERKAGRRRSQRGQPRTGGRMGRARGGRRGDDLHAGRDADGQDRAHTQLRRARRADGRDLRGRHGGGAAPRRGVRRDVRPPVRGPGRDRGAGHDRPRARRAAARAGDGRDPGRRRRALFGDRARAQGAQAGREDRRSAGGRVRSSGREHRARLHDRRGHRGQAPGRADVAPARPTCSSPSSRSPTRRSARRSSS